MSGLVCFLELGFSVACHLHTSTVSNRKSSELLREFKFKKRRKKVNPSFPVLTESMSRIIMADPVLAFLGNQITQFSAFRDLFMFL